MKENRSEIDKAKNKLKNLFIESFRTEEDLFKNYNLFGQASDKNSVIETKPYFIMYNRWGYPQNSNSLWLIANSADRFIEIDATLDVLARENLIHSEHDLTAFNEYTFNNFVERIELDYENLAFFKSLFDPEKPDENTYYKIFDYWKNKLDDYYEELKRTDEISAKVLSIFKQSNIVSSSDKNQLISLLREKNNRIGFYTFQGDPTQLSLMELNEIVDDMNRMLLIIDKQDLENFKFLFELSLGYRLGAVKEIFEEEDKYIVGLLFAKVNEMNIITNYESTTFLDKSLPEDQKKPLFSKIALNAQQAQELYNAYWQNLNNILRDYHSQYLEKPNNDINLTLLFAGKTLPSFGIQQSIYIPYNLCLGNYIFHDQLSFGVKEKIKEILGPVLAENVSIQSNEFVLRDIHFMDENYWILSNELNPAWEFGIKLENADEALLQLYAKYKGKNNDSAHTYIQMPLPYFILYNLMHYAESLAVEDNNYLLALEKASAIIKEYQLIVPKRYHEILFTSGLFSNEEVEIAKENYQIALDQQLKFVQDFKDMEANKYKSRRIARIIQHEDFDEVVFVPEKTESAQLIKMGIFKDPSEKEAPATDQESEAPKPK